MKPVLMVLMAVVIMGCKARRVSVVPPAPTPTVVKPAISETAKKPEPASPAPSQVPRRPRRIAQSSTPVERQASPALELVRTPEEKEAILVQIRESVARAEANLATLRSRQLIDEDARNLGRIDSFLRQARAAENARDLATARQYAERAELLSRDLLRR